MQVKNPIKNCSEVSCYKKIIFLYNVRSKSLVPVDYSSLTPDEITLIEVAPKTRAQFKADVMICFNADQHVSHFKTCKKPNLFSGKGKKE